ncbi:probable F-box protein At2g36090 [Typha latifolia]|uniref:probable F-box protein At2g36090 n=1 Tax=Typha latifolia TaxID=4733 RepID=UPI003C2E53F1
MAHGSGAATSSMSTTIEDIHPDVLRRALRLLDGPALAAAGCATSHLRSLATDPALWREICLSTWPSLGHPRLLSLSHRALFADAHSFPQSESATLDSGVPVPLQLISAVDLYHGGKPVFSRVVETDASSPWFLGSPFRVDALDRKDPPPAPVTSPAELSLSWIVIDPARRRAVNISSRSPVAVERHWYTGETLVRFATAISGFAFEAVVTCGEEAGHVSEISLGVEDADGITASGRDSLVILAAAMEGRRRRRGEEEEVKREYEEFVKGKRWRREKKARGEFLVDFCCTAVGAAAFVAFVLMVAFR